MQRTMSEINKATGSSLKIDGILRTMFDKSNLRSKEISDKLESAMEAQLFKTIVPRCSLLAEAPSLGKPIMYLDADSQGSLAYLSLAGEIINKFEERGGFV